MHGFTITTTTANAQGKHKKIKCKNVRPTQHNQ